MSNLLKDNKELMKEYDFFKNKDLNLEELTLGNNKKIWWKCSKGHSWLALISSRSYGRGCPVCSGSQVLAGYNDLATTNPELAKEWNYNKNGSLTPQQVSKGSHKKVWWCCNEGHSWTADIHSRITGNGCPYCSNHKVLAGYNDLETTNKELLKEWDYDKNGKLKPEQLSYGSGRNVWWKCSKGHSYQKQIRHKINSVECPICSGKQVLVGYNDLATTNPELAKEWNYNKNGSLTPQNVTSGSGKNVWWKCNKCSYEWKTLIYSRGRLNSGCPSCVGRALLVGYNDLAHKYPNVAKDWDYEKNANLRPEQFLYGSSVKVWWKCPKNHSWQTAISNRTKGTGCPICSHNQILIGYNDLATTNPELAKEWDYEKNVDLNPEQVTKSSNQIVWWICSKGHEWQATSKDRNAGSGCPICSGRQVLAGYNDLLTTNPELAKEWNYEKNGKLEPNDITSGSNNSVWWICSKGHEWQAVISNRNRGDGCPYCSGRRVLIGFNDIKTLLPNMSKEWDYEKNVGLNPEQFSKGSIKKVWWKCEKGHSWQSSVNTRYSNNGGCPICSGKQVLVGYNDLATTNPELAKEWNYNKNGSLTPQQITLGSNKKVWWVCHNGHEWCTSLKQRTSSSSNCPVCSKRFHSSFAEQTIYFYVKKMFSDAINGYKPYYLKNMEYDIFIPTKKVAIEYDGRQWHKKNVVKKREKLKYDLSKENGIYLIRIRENGKGSCLNICDEYCNIDGSDDSFKAALTLIAKRLDTMFDVDVNRDRFSILENYYFEFEKNSFGHLEPAMALDWHPTRNGRTTPYMFTKSSHQKVWWKCHLCGYEWQSTINHRTSFRIMCQKCKQKK